MICGKQYSPWNTTVLLCFVFYCPQWVSWWFHKLYLGWGFESSLGQDTFCLKNFGISTKTSFRVSKMNAVSRARLTFQMSTLLKKYLYRQCQYSITWDIKCLALIAQIVRAFGMNPKVGGSSPPQVDTFSVSKTLSPSQEHSFVCRKWMLLPAHC